MRRPLLIAQQARDARGWLGRVIAFVMARETWSGNRRAIDALEVRPGDSVIDVGSGHGRSVADLAALASRGRIAAIDSSELMVQIATPARGSSNIDATCREGKGANLLIRRSPLGSAVPSPFVERPL